MQHLNNILAPSIKLVALMAILFVNTNAVANSFAQTEASVQCDLRYSDCITDSAEHNYWNDLRTQGYRLQEVAVFLNPDGSDPRSPVTAQDNIPGLGRVKLYTKRNGSDVYAGMGSGFMINECLMITNKHVVMDEGDIKISTVEFEPGISFPDLKTRARNASKGQVVASGNYVKGDNATTHEDWVVVKLDRNVGREIGYLKPSFEDYNNLIDRKDLTVAGVIEDNITNTSMNLQKHVNCKSGLEDIRWRSIKGLRQLIGTGGITTSCSSLPGTSGSPLMIKNENGSYVAVGLMRNGYSNEHLTKWDDDNANVFIPFVKNAIMSNNEPLPQSLTEERLNQIIGANPCHR